MFVKARRRLVSSGRILELYRKGLTKNQICDATCFSEGTIEKWISRFKKEAKLLSDDRKGNKPPKVDHGNGV